MHAGQWGRSCVGCWSITLRQNGQCGVSGVVEKRDEKFSVSDGRVSRSRDDDDGPTSDWVMRGRRGMKIGTKKVTWEKGVPLVHRRGTSFSRF